VLARGARWARQVSVNGGGGRAGSQAPARHPSMSLAAGVGAGAPRKTDPPNKGNRLELRRGGRQSGEGGTSQANGLAFGFASPTARFGQLLYTQVLRFQRPARTAPKIKSTDPPLVVEACSFLGPARSSSRRIQFVPPRPQALPPPAGEQPTEPLPTEPQQSLIDPSHSTSLPRHRIASARRPFANPQKGRPRWDAEAAPRPAGPGPCRPRRRCASQSRSTATFGKRRSASVERSR